MKRGGERYHKWKCGVCQSVPCPGLVCWDGAIKQGGRYTGWGEHTAHNTGQEMSAVFSILATQETLIVQIRALERQIQTQIQIQSEESVLATRAAVIALVGDRG